MDRAIRVISFAIVLALAAGAEARQGGAPSAGAGDDDGVQPVSSSPGLLSQDDRVGQALETMQDEIERLREDNESMRGEIDELRALSNDDWMTERRADEIRALVEDVLVDAESRASLLGSGVTAGWDDGFFVASADGNFRLNIAGQLQIRWIFNYHDEDPKYLNGWEVTRAKLTFDGHVFTPDLTYLVRIDPTRNEPMLVTGLYFLQDAWVRYRLSHEWSVRAGQFKLPFNREELVSSAYQLAVERSLVNENTNIGRSQGLEFTYTSDFHRLSIATSDGGTDNLGGFNAFVESQPINTPWSNPTVEFSITSRYEALLAGNWKQFEQFTSPPGQEFGMLFGIAGHYQKNDNDGLPSAVRNEAEWIAWTADLSVQWGGANLFTSFTQHYIESPVAGGTNLNIYGWVVQGGVYLTNKVEVYGRFEYGWYDEFDFADLTTCTFGFNYYIDGQDVKFTSDIGFGISRVEANWDSDIAGWRVDGDGAEPQIVFRTQLQLLF